MKEKTMAIPAKDKFSLSKVKLIRDGGLDVTYDVTEVVGNESYTNKYHVENVKDVHPDLRKLFKQLAVEMAKMFSPITPKGVAEALEVKMTAKQKEACEKIGKSVQEKFEVRGVSFTGSGDNIGVVITGLYTFDNGLKTAINSPRVKFDNPLFGNEEELEEICTEIENEVYEFLFEGKSAQLELFT